MTRALKKTSRVKLIPRWAQDRSQDAEYLYALARGDRLWLVLDALMGSGEERMGKLSPEMIVRMLDQEAPAHRKQPALCDVISEIIALLPSEDRARLLDRCSHAYCFECGGPLPCDCALRDCTTGCVCDASNEPPDAFDPDTGKRNTR